MSGMGTFNRRGLLQCGIAAGAIGLLPAGRVRAATEAEANRKINISGRQRMLTQRMSRSAVYAALDVEAERHIELLEVSRADFSKALDGLHYGDADLGLPEEEYAAVREQIEVVEELWYPFESMVRRIVDRGEAREREILHIAETNVSLLKEANTLVELLVEYYGREDTDMGRAIAINIAGRQRMLSQKMTKETGLSAYGWRPDVTRVDLKETMRLFEDSLAALMSGNPSFTLPRPPEEVWQQLTVVKGLWADFKPEVAKFLPEEKTIERHCLFDVASRSDPVLANVHKAVNLYEVAA